MPPRTLVRTVVAASAAVVFIFLAIAAGTGPAEATAPSGVTPCVTACSQPLQTTSSTMTWAESPSQITLTNAAQAVQFDEAIVNQNDPDGLGSFSFNMHYDPSLLSAPVFDVGPATALFTATGRTLACNVVNPIPGTAQLTCTSTGNMGVGPIFVGPQPMAHVTLSQIDSQRPAGFDTLITYTDTTVLNTCGQPPNDGTSQTPACSGNLEPGVGAAGMLSGAGVEVSMSPAPSVGGVAQIVTGTQARSAQGPWPNMVTWIAVCLGACMLAAAWAGWRTTRRGR